MRIGFTFDKLSGGARLSRRHNRIHKTVSNQRVCAPAKDTAVQLESAASISATQHRFAASAGGHQPGARQGVVRVHSVQLALERPSGHAHHTAPTEHSAASYFGLLRRGTSLVPLCGPSVFHDAVQKVSPTGKEDDLTATEFTQNTNGPNATQACAVY